MSQFKVEVVTVEVGTHPNADKLDLVKVKGWQCVAQKGQYKTGDLALYIPIDSQLPPELVTKLGIEKMYHKRIKTIKLRGYISQGMVAPLSILTCEAVEGNDYAVHLGITKYEEPIPVSMSGIQAPKEPNFFTYTDIENIKNFPTALKKGEMVVVTEKIHGTNFRAAKIDGKLFAGSHNTNLVRNSDNLYWRAAILLDLENKLAEGEQVFGEVYGAGVQDLTYGKKPGEIGVRIFDVVKDKVYLDYTDYLQYVLNRGLETAPTLITGEWGSFDHLVLASGKSTIQPDQIKEGVVIRPFKERFSEELQGRCIVKVISDEYLLRKDATEHH